ncbi:low affinity iron permease family protein [Candidatus Mycosynbacter amalyticus]|uniref:Low affinity iron permease family protein n=1 Tax=Candidatus Mycosynbacter amalyticus TaxID=2665156 RepID=A0A857MK55_9BACT|nr:low affinity iron permease family protein [Candidatus Mycosynbacter amalyticus]QHN42518.1 low affinity iron permease family protein [Candidatus Mycosynbacter amalyticus]
MKETFRRAATRVSNLTGTAGVFLGAVAIVLIWGITGPLFNFSDTWQLVINTGTTIVTFLMVFLIQNTQNRDGKAIQIKLDELIRATGARTQYVGLEDLSDQDLATLDEGFKRMAQNADSAHAIEKMRAKLSDEHTRRHKLRQHSTNSTPPIEKPAVVAPTQEASLPADGAKITAPDGRTYRQVHGRMLPRHRTHPHANSSQRVLR